MRKILVIIISILLVLTLGACSTDESSSTSQDQLETETITLYFSDKDVMYLVPEDREVEKVTGEVIVKELINGPKNPDLYSVIPEGVQVLGVNIKDDVAFVDLNKVFEEKVQGSTGESFAVYSIVNSITANKSLNVNKVQILIEGNVVETIAGHLDTSEPLEPNLEMIAK